MPTSSPNTMNIIDDALFCSTPLTLSYADPDQIWIIRKHLETLFQEFPSLEPSVGVFTNNDGKDVKLLKASGELHVSPNAPPVPLTIWVHELYPQMAPFVYISYQIYKNYPNADSSGAITSSYLQNWNYDISNLSGLARNLIELFSLNHPFYDSGWAHSSNFSEMDRLASSIQYDKAANIAKTVEEIANSAAAQLKLKKRGESLEIAMRKLDEERRRLKGRSEELREECDELLGRLKLYDEGDWADLAIDDPFEALNEEEKVKLDRVVADCVAADREVDDVMDVLDVEMKEGVVSFDVYMKRVRELAREQFFQRATKRKIERPGQGFLLD